jgi:hypothetical protein
MDEIVETRTRNTKTKTSERRRIDAMLALPLARFRRALTAASEDELTAIEARIAVQMVRSRWARGSHGVARHRATNELALLDRRLSETRRELAARRVPALAPISVLDSARDEAVSAQISTDLAA